MYTAQLESNQNPFVIRYPRGEGVLINWKTPFEEIIIGKGRKIKDGEDVAILSLGHPGNFATAAIRELKTQGLNPAHYDMRFVKPLDEELLHEVFAKFDKIVTVEDGTVVGGFGSAILEFMMAHGYQAEVKILGIPDTIVEHGTPKELHRECGYDAQGIAETVRVIFRTTIKRDYEFGLG
ncbi:MAG: transketolase C-terminal domain-containing protein [Segetibacter sp.]